MHEPPALAGEPEKGLAALVLCVLLTLSALFGAWRLASAYAGEDFFLHWCVAQEIGNPEIGDIYSDSGRDRIGALNLRRAAEPGASPHIRTVSERYPRPMVLATPFLYTLWAAFTGADYRWSYAAYRLLTLLCTVGAILVFARACRLGWLAALLAVAFFTWPMFEPFLSVSRTSNVSQLQLGMLAGYLGTRFGPPGRARDIVGGALLGLAIAFKPNVLWAVVLVLAVQGFDRRFRSLAVQAGAAAGAVLVAWLWSTLALAQPSPWLSWIDSTRAFLEVNRPVEHGNYSAAKLLQARLGFDPSLLLTALLLGLSAFVLRRRRGEHDGPLRAAEALALGLAVTLLSAPIVWLHYYNLAVPLCLLCLRPGAGREALARVAVAGAAVFLLALQPLIQLDLVTGAYPLAVTCATASAVLMGVAVVGAWRTAPPSSSSSSSPSS